jgi:hypothetical protein
MNLKLHVHVLVLGLFKVGRCTTNNTHQVRCGGDAMYWTRFRQWSTSRFWKYEIHLYKLLVEYGKNKSIGINTQARCLRLLWVDSLVIINCKSGAWYEPSLSLWNINPRKSNIWRMQLVECVGPIKTHVSNHCYVDQIAKVG